MSERGAARHHADAVERRRSEAVEALEAGKIPEALHALSKLMKHTARLNPEGSIMYGRYRSAGMGMEAWARILRAQD